MSDVDPKLLNYRKKGARLTVKHIQAIEARVSSLEAEIAKLKKEKNSTAKKAASKKSDDGE